MGKLLTIYTDGACQVSTGNGGVGVVFIKDNEVIYQSHEVHGLGDAGGRRPGAHSVGRGRRGRADTCGSGRNGNRARGGQGP